LLGALAAVFVAALGGNWAGNQLRTLATGEPGAQMHLSHVNAQGETVIGATVVLTNFVPALLAGFIGKPRWLYAFAGGMLASVLLGERYEQRVWALLNPADQVGKPAQ
jgi:hypothetical protein